MITIRKRLKVSPDGNIVLPIGADESGVEFEVTAISISGPAHPTAASLTRLPHDQWMQKFLRLEGSIAGIERPKQLPLDPIPGFD